MSYPLLGGYPAPTQVQRDVSTAGTFVFVLALVLLVVIVGKPALALNPPIAPACVTCRGHGATILTAVRLPTPSAQVGVLRNLPAEVQLLEHAREVGLAKQPVDSIVSLPRNAAQRRGSMYEAQCQCGYV